jgi:P4 family phage/plasmid primase-like protien
MLTLLPDLFAPVWDPANPGANWHEVITVEEALDREFETDAMILPYYVERHDGSSWSWVSLSPRLKKQHVTDLESHGYRVRCRYGILDVDDREAHARDAEASISWRQAAHEAIDRLVPGAALYDTRRGLRVIWRLPIDLAVEQYEDELTRARRVLAEANFPADPLPWNQAFRLPRVVRDGVPQRRWIRSCSPAVWSPPAAPRAAKATQGSKPSTVDRFRLPEYVGKGERHDTLKRLAASLRAQGLERDEILLGLQDADSRVCDPPVGSTPDGKRELDQLADYYGSLPGGKSEQFRSSSETIAFEAAGIVPFARGDARELAERLLALVEEPTRGHGPDGGVVEAVVAEGKFWVYSPGTGLWGAVDRDYLHARVLDFAGMPVEAGNDKSGAPKFRSLRLRSADAIDAVRAAYWRRAQPGFFRQAPVGLALADGFIEITPAGELHHHPHAPRWRARMGYDFAYTDEAPSLWSSFQHQVFDPHGEASEQMIRFLDEACGAGLVGIAPRYAKAVLCLGDGSNGKSATLYVIEACFPEQTVSALAPHQFKNDHYMLAELVGKRLNLCSEVSATMIDSKAAADLKLAIRGERMTTRRIAESPFDFCPQALVIGALNALPRVQDVSTGFFRSWACLPFLRKFEPAEQDVNLPKRIVELDRQRIVCHWLRSAAELVRRGHYDEPDVSKEVVQDWRKGLDPILQFVDDALEPDETGSTFDALFQAFRQWCQRSGYAEMEKATFARRFADPCRAKFGAKFSGPTTKRQKVYLCRSID